MRSNDIIPLALKLRSFKQKYESELVDIETELWITTIITEKAMEKVEYLDYKRGMYKRMILHLGKSLGDMKDQIELDL